jgi:hypothetical protein
LNHLQVLAKPSPLPQDSPLRQLLSEVSMFSAQPPILKGASYRSSTSQSISGTKPFPVAEISFPAQCHANNLKKQNITILRIDRRSKQKQPRCECLIKMSRRMNYARVRQVFGMTSVLRYKTAIEDNPSRTPPIAQCIHGAGNPHLSPSMTRIRELPSPCLNHPFL